MRRGDVVTVAGGVYASKPRPALVVQDDRFDTTGSVTVCPFTTAQVDAPLLRVPVNADDVNGLSQDSFLMVDQLTTVRRTNVGTVLGRLESTTMVEFERRFLVFLGFGTKRWQGSSARSPLPRIRPVPLVDLSTGPATETPLARRDLSSWMDKPAPST